jgi:hypothetical protein
MGFAIIAWYILLCCKRDESSRVKQHHRAFGLALMKKSLCARSTKASNSFAGPGEGQRPKFPFKGIYIGTYSIAVSGKHGPVGYEEPF